MTYLEYYKSLYEKYPEWDPGLVNELDEMNLLDDIERISGILVSLPKDASLKMMAEAIDPEHIYKTTCNTEKGAYRVLRLVYRDRDTGEWHYRNKAGVPTEADIRLNRMANLYCSFVNTNGRYLGLTRDKYKKGDHSDMWEWHFKYHTDFPRERPKYN